MNNKTEAEILQAIIRHAEEDGTHESCLEKYSENGARLINYLAQDGLSLFYSEQISDDCGDNLYNVYTYYSDKIKKKIVIDNDTCEFCEFFEDFKELASVIYQINQDIIALESKLPQLD